MFRMLRRFVSNLSYTIWLHQRRKQAKLMLKNLRIILYKYQIEQWESAVSLIYDLDCYKDLKQRLAMWSILEYSERLGASGKTLYIRFRPFLCVRPVEIIFEKKNNVFNVYKITY